MRAERRGKRQVVDSGAHNYSLDFCAKGNGKSSSELDAGVRSFWPLSGGSNRRV
jgi:hypothetical protein